MFALSVKRAVDMVGGIIALIVALPLIALIAWFIRRDGGRPVIFRQVRSGLLGREFVLFKFRTMRAGDPLRWNEDGSARVTSDDPRLTRVGRPLREFGLDELPQLLNVVRGDMSLVGPRPYVPEHTARLPRWARRRLDMRPGLVGLTEVSGRNALPWQRRLELDTFYVDHWSLWLDVMILLRTVPVVLFRRGVYSAMGSGETPRKNRRFDQTMSASPEWAGRP